MKKLTLLLVLFTLIKLNSFGQHTPETAKVLTTWQYFGKSANIDNSSFGNAIPGINYGSLNNTSRLAWFLIPLCASEDFQIGFTSNNNCDSVGYTVFGPFLDTNQITTNLLVSTPISSSSFQYLWNSNFSAYIQNQGAGLYLVALNLDSISGQINIVAQTNFSPIYTYRLCDYCNSAVYLDHMFCLVTTDSTTQRTKLIFDNSDTANIQGYILFRENNIAGQYDSLTFIHRDSSNYYIDMTANPAIRNWRYLMHRLDQCNQRPIPYYQGNGYFWKANTLHLQQGVSTNNSINLTWNNSGNNVPILGTCCFNPTLYVYRSNGSGAFVAIDSIPTNTSSYTDVNPSQGLNLYQIVMKKTAPCTITRNNETEARSNTISTTFTGIHNPVKHNFFKLYPNPAQHEFTVEINENNKDWRLSLFNLQGQLLKTEDAKSKSKIQLNCEDLPAGIYTVKVSYLNSDYYKKLVIE
ncbi:MAG: T9SS type A sorting domain-containing protein [Bacteroidetes bacterium]|nr:T9SS type A sorting domain-containing protein [Bacteroidota bacterium]